jgi:predicted RNA-binding Zn ribbon-like protein
MNIILALINASTGVILIRMEVEAVRDREVSSIRGERRFELRGGVACLDFVNTVGWRLTDRPSEYLRSYEDLLDWGRQAGLLAPVEAEGLSRRATLDPEGTEETLRRAIALREAIHRVISRSIAGEPQADGGPSADLSALNRELSIALSRLRVRSADDAYTWGWDRGGDEGQTPLDSPLWPVVHSAAQLLTSEKLGRVKLCAGEGCGWVFLDESRNSSRRWCDSRDCGNRERVRRHLARKRASGS